MVQSKVNAIEIQGVSKIYGSGVESVKALDNANLNIFDNEFFTLLGPSGCGKTTLLRLIAGFEDITEGIINLFGQELITLPPNKRPVNTVFQQYSLFPHLNVFENVAFGLRRLKKSSSFINKRTKDVLELVQMHDFISRKTNQLSGGQQQRIALARALAPEPKVLLLDEPLSALDLKLRQAMRVELKTLQKETGITFVFVTHDQEEALTMSDRIAVINEGRIQQIGDPESIYEKPSNQFVAKFIGEANLISGKCLQTGKNGILELNSGQKISVDISLNYIIGENVTIFIRPERVKIKKSNKNSNAKIQEFTYLGNAAHIQIISNDEIVNATLPIDKASNFKQGDKIDLEFPKDFVRIINS